MGWTMGSVTALAPPECGYTHLKAICHLAATGGNASALRGMLSAAYRSTFRIQYHVTYMVASGLRNGYRVRSESESDPVASS